MQFPCEIDNLKTLKKGMKITLAVADEDVKRVMKDIYNFMDKPVIVNLNVDVEEQKERLQQISPDQRKKIYAIFRDIANWTGDEVESLKKQMKIDFIQNTEYEMFSLANCSKELANDFIEYLIRFCFEYGVPIEEADFRNAFDDIERYLAICLEKKKCCICGQPAEEHHWDAIGAGRDRTKVDDSKLRKIALCRKHHIEAHQIGRDSFEAKYHVYGIIWNG